MTISSSGLPRILQKSGGNISVPNPNWPLQVLKDLMHMHLSTTKDELVARYTANFPGDVKAYDQLYEHILKMSDALSDGIVKQFPTKF